MEVLKVTLKQHTPLIHFQHDQYGATLRASEVKPKLDKFIIKYLGNDNLEKGITTAKEKGWLIGDKDTSLNDEKFALNYKMEIRPLGEIFIWDINQPKKDNNTGNYIRDKKGFIKLNNYPAFFANLNSNYEDPKEYKKFSFTNDKILMQLIFKDQTNGLFDLISNQKDIISDFFFSYNFGMRSSKGFGSFFPDEQDIFYKKNYTKNRFSISSNSTDKVQQFKDLFKGIDLFYRSLRGGINELDRNGNVIFYFKSFIRSYCQEKLNKEWEKKKIQLSLLETDQNSNKYSDDYLDVKDLFGFSTNEEWRGNLYKNAKIKKNAAIEDASGWRNPNNNEMGDLPERMKSPILFKPIYNETTNSFDVFIRFMSKQVNLAQFLNTKKIAVNINNRKTIFVDLPKEFKFSDFFNYIFNDSDFDLHDYIDKEYHNHAYFKILNKIYTDIENNRNI